MPLTTHSHYPVSSCQAGVQILMTNAICDLGAHSNFFDIRTGIVLDLGLGTGTDGQRNIPVPNCGADGVRGKHAMSTFPLRGQVTPLPLPAHNAGIKKAKAIQHGTISKSAAMTHPPPSTQRAGPSGPGRQEGYGPKLVGRPIPYSDYLPGLEAGSSQRAANALAPKG